MASSRMVLCGSVIVSPPSGMFHVVCVMFVGHANGAVAYSRRQKARRSTGAALRLAGESGAGSECASGTRRRRERRLSMVRVVEGRGRVGRREGGKEGWREY